MTLNGAHTVGATSLTITGGSGVLLAGDWISINQSYQRAAGVSGHLVRDRWRDRIVPGLRAAESSGAAVTHFAIGSVYDSMEVVGDPDFPAAEPSPLPGHYQPFAVEFLTALRVSP